MSTKDEKTKAEEAKAKTEPVDLAEILAPMGGKIVSAKDLGAALKAGGYKPIEVVGDLKAAGKIRQLGNTGLDDDGNPTGFRFLVYASEELPEIWVRAQHGPAVSVPGLGRFDRVGRLLEDPSAADLANLRGRGVPVEVIDDKGEIAKIKAEAEKRAKAAAHTVDKEAAVLAELG